MEGNPEKSLLHSLVPVVGLCLALAGFLIAASAGFGSRWGWWRFGTGFSVLRWSVYIAIVAAVISLLGTAMSRPGSSRRGIVLGIIGVLLSVPVIVLPLSWNYKAHSVPRIHDISTDVINPPQFVANVNLRTGAVNSLQYGGPAIAAQQQAAYPDIKPIISNKAPAVAFDDALQSAIDLGWKVDATDPSQGRIEATDTTFWFGFTDDIVIRIVPQGGGSRLDIRSVSRVGLSDVGTNAARIRAFKHCFLKTGKTV